MDKIDSYKNLNEQVNRLLRKREVSDINEEVKIAAQELVEALEDPNRVTMLMRSGLVDSGRVARVRTALKDPEKAMKNTAVRSDLINMLMSLINIITSNPTAFAAVKKKAKEMGSHSSDSEEMKEELIGGQKKLDVNKNGKVDGADLAALRAGKKKTDDDEEEMDESWNLSRRPKRI